MKKVFIWGTGYVADRVFHECRTLDQYDFIGAIDSDKKKWGQAFHGLPIMPPDILLDQYADAVIVLTDCFDEIRRQIVNDYPGIKITIENKNFFYKESVIQRYRNSKEPEIREVLDYIEKTGLDVFNYPFVEKYNDPKNKVWKDEGCGLYFVMHNGKRLYFSRKYKSEKEAGDYYNALLKEQDERSPHRYLSEECNVNEGDIVLDIGAAEGNFSLDVIDRCSHLYIFEAENDWIEALQYTFKDYADKVTFIKGFVGAYHEGTIITIDSVVDVPVNFIKMDIEGNEWDALRGAERLINNSANLKMVICSYHSDFDQELIESFMDKHHITHTCSKGYMWFPETIRQTYVSTSLNRGIVRGIKYGRQEEVSTL